MWTINQMNIDSMTMSLRMLHEFLANVHSRTNEQRVNCKSRKVNWKRNVAQKIVGCSFQIKFGTQFHTEMG